jgi:hypothetical protein
MSTDLALAPAHAAWDWSITDGFENNPNGRWTRNFHGAGTAANYDTAGLRARTGFINAWMTAGASNTYVTIRRNVTLQLSGPSRCGASVYLSSVPGAAVNLEIIDPATWDYASLRTVLVEGNGYQRHEFNAWEPRTSTVILRISLLGDLDYLTIPGPHLRIDDVELGCSELPS